MSLLLTFGIGLHNTTHSPPNGDGFHQLRCKTVQRRPAPLQDGRDENDLRAHAELSKQVARMLIILCIPNVYVELEHGVTKNEQESDPSEVCSECVELR